MSWESIKQSVSGTVSQAYESAKDSVQKYAKNMTAPLGDLNAISGLGTAGTNAYNVEGMTYPSDLMNDMKTYGGNYVMFYINIQQSSKLINSKADELLPIGSYSRVTSDMVANKNNLDQLMTAQGVITGGKMILGGAVGGAGGAVAAGADVLGLGAVASMAATGSRQTRRLKTAIALHVPNQLSIRYGMQYDEADTAMLQALTRGGAELAQALEKGSNKDTDGAKQNGANLGDIAKGFLGSEALQKNAGVSAATGLAGNPKKEQVFKGVDFRNFQFEYQFFPRDENEASNVLEIIKQFKYHMHPEFKDSNSFLYVYPSEFDIVYYTGGKENENINRLTSCVLTEMNVNYTPNGNFTTFANGMPTQINVTLSFRELALLSKELIDKGM